MFEDDIMAALGISRETAEQPARFDPAPRPQRTKQFKRKLRREYGSLQNARSVSAMVREAFARGLTWSGSYTCRRERLTALGFDDYGDYLQSPYWVEVRRAYRDSGLLQRCMVCGDANFVLHHVGYAHLGSEKPHKLLPLCDRHHKRLHRLLVEHGLPLEFSFKALPCCLAKHVDFAAFNRRLLPYRKQLLGHMCGQRCLTYHMSLLQIGGKKSNKRDKYRIEIRGPGGTTDIYYCGRTGRASVGRNGAMVAFERVCDRLPHGRQPRPARKEQDG